MSGQMIITIGREFGSGGHEIAELIASHYGIQFYDKQLIQEVAEDGMISPSVVAQFDEKPLSVFARPMPGDGSNLSMEQQIALRTFTYLNKQANVNKVSFVVVGRCAECFLVGNPALTRIFVLGDQDVKRKRIMEKYQLDGKQALLRMRREDKLRKSYHNFYCESKWGDSRTYDLCVNSSLLGVEKTADALIQFLDLRYA
ncbi:MAG: cytidylate kinase-like family protein [Clostridiales bacterium]|nr:cytidylate kinase-like family protein [Clostridiales bacterium]MCD8127106.1 cytidylate kinase-like family protein [Clostridiales bacterium]